MTIRTTHKYRKEFSLISAQFEFKWYGHSQDKCFRFDIKWRNYITSYHLLVIFIWLMKVKMVILIACPSWINKKSKTENYNHLQLNAVSKKPMLQNWVVVMMPWIEMYTITFEYWHHIQCCKLAPCSCFYRLSFWNFHLIKKNTHFPIWNWLPSLARFAALQSDCIRIVYSARQQFQAEFGHWELTKAGEQANKQQELTGQI